MSDEVLRALARSGDDTAKLEREWIRRGLGWYGETLPRGLVPKPERRVYFRVGQLSTEFVYVPGGDVTCERCGGKGLVWDNFVVSPGRPPEQGYCPACDGTGKSKIPPFYLGRFPVVWGEWRAFLAACQRPSSPWVIVPHESFVTGADFQAKTSFDRRPATSASYAEAVMFCEWAGLRLPSADEWRWAALGGRAQDVEDPIGRARCPTCQREMTSEPWLAECPAITGICVEHGPQTGLVFLLTKSPRRFPWGNEPPMPERCVWSGHPGHGARLRRVDPDVVGGAPEDLTAPEDLAFFGGDVLEFSHGSAAPVVAEAACTAHRGDGSVAFKQGDLIPARWLGESWCGAQDMCGNVWEILSNGHTIGGSFRTPARGHGVEDLAKALTFAFPPSTRGRERDDVGFRVSMDAVR